MGDEVLSKIIEQVRDARFFSLLVDETSDISRQEQVSFVLRYVNKDCDIQERFIGMVTVSHTDSATLVNTIEEVLSGHNLSIKDIRGQGYDGAANMSG
jgi:cobalamin biosynthesis protein CbiG